jgi:hypothetical protein
LILAAFWQQMLPTRPVLPVLPTAKYYFIKNLVFDPQQGMEEVIGSIPIRSTNFSPFLGANRRQFCAPLNRGAPLLDLNLAAVSIIFPAPLLGFRRSVD